VQGEEHVLHVVLELRDNVVQNVLEVLRRFLHFAHDTGADVAVISVHFTRETLADHRCREGTRNQSPGLVKLWIGEILVFV